MRSVMVYTPWNLIPVLSFLSYLKVYGEKRFLFQVSESFLASLLTLGYATYSQCKGNVVNVTESKEAEVLSHCLQYSLCYLTFQMWEIAIFLQRSKAMVLRTILSCFPVIIQSGSSMPLVLRKELLER